MSESVRGNGYTLPTPRVVMIGNQTFIKYGISPLKMAELRAMEQPSFRQQSPMTQYGQEYVYNSRGKLVRLERFDPNTMEEYYLTPTSCLTENEEKQLEDATTRPILYDADCPEASPEQLERFRKFGQERNRRRAESEQTQTGN